jgi:hypothetical protein
MAKLNAFKVDLPTPVEWALRHNHKPVFHYIEVLGKVMTHGGEMIKVRLANNVDLANPGYDIAALIGKVVVKRASGKLDPLSPELWFWNDKFWVKAHNSQNSVYYRDKAYLIYEIQPNNVETLMSMLASN